MATVKVKFRPSTVAGREGTVYYQIIHERRVRQLITSFRIHESEWDAARSMVRISHSSERRNHLLAMRDAIRRDLDRLVRIDRHLDARGIQYTSDDVIDEYLRYTSRYTLFNYAEEIIDKLRRNGKTRTSETYRATLNSFRKFRKDEDIMLDNINGDIMEAYEARLRDRGLTQNSISFYTRILRAVYNRAVENDIIEDRNPFRHVYTGVDKTVRRALPLATIRKIKMIDLSRFPALDFSRDMFMMSFYLRGMSFIDMAFLRKSDLCNGHVIYRRRKTGQLLSVKWTRDMQYIIDKYPGRTTQYLLPIIRSGCTNERCAYRNAGYNINHCLKKIAPMVGVTIPLTLYVARHSWASAARTKGIPVSVISEGMGHDSETTTRIYLASLDTSVVDRANALILKSL